jgi:hypothetical protein
MLEFVVDRVNPRKLHLFVCGCCRRPWIMADGDHVEALETAERYADGLITEGELGGASIRVRLSDRATSLEAKLALDCCLSGSSEPRRLQGAYEWAAIAGTDAPAEWKYQGHLIRCIFGNPFRPVTVDPSWLTSTVVSLAQGIYAERAFDRLPILADALQDAGCDNPDVLDHCRGPGPHVRGCWVVDLVLGKS